MNKAKNRLIKIKKNGISVATDTVGAQLASIIINNGASQLELMNQGLLDPENSAYGKTAPNLVMTPGPAATFDKKTLTPAKNDKGDEMPVIQGKIGEKSVTAIEYLYNNFPYFATQHGWAQYLDYALQGGGKHGDDYYILVNDEDFMSPFKFRHHVACMIEDDGSIKYITELTNTGNAPIPGGLGWHPVFKLHEDVSRYSVVFEDVEFEDANAEDKSAIHEGLEIDCESIINAGKGVKFDGVKSATVTIYYETKEGKKIPYLKVKSECPVWVLWGKGDGFAIEPWNTSATRIFEHITNQNDLSFAEDKGYKVLQPGETTSITTIVEVYPEYINYLEKDYDLKTQKRGEEIGYEYIHLGR